MTETLKFLCFNCDAQFTHTIDQSELISFKNKYGEFKGMKCVVCKKGNAKHFGYSLRNDTARDVKRNNHKTNLYNMRRDHHDALLQPYRDGDFSKEYRDAYPEQSRKMVQAGVITREQYSKAKNVWNGDEIR